MLGNVRGDENPVRSLNVSEAEMKWVTRKWTNMTNLEDGDLTRIEHAMYIIGFKDANIIDINQNLHFLFVLWTIHYDQLKPLG
jgi:hypothetical protein